jgi:2-polyprenyl-6-methoxyphenol hydroxylase-like FAD-dependent oxidoreductase
MAARKPKVLISGLGVAGTTLAWWLIRQGFTVTIVEAAPEPRSGGYMIDFWGPGYEVAERMGLIEDLRAVSYPIHQLRLVRSTGGAFAVLDVETLGKALGGRFFSLLRSDLAGVLYRRIQHDVEVRFGDRVLSLEADDSGVRVAFEHSRSAKFDLVVGADGVHSPIRRQLFGAACEHPLDFWTASFSTVGYPRRDPGAYVTFTRVGRQVGRYALRDDRTAFLFVFRRPTSDRPPRTLAEQKACLRRVFGQDGWECSEILDRLDGAGDLYFDEVSQAVPPRWSKGRVALVGDAAYCPSLLAGEGASLAMAGAMVLAGELGRAGGDHGEAFQRYERHLRRPIERKQRGALAMGAWFAPKTPGGLFVRDALSRIAAMPALTGLIVGPIVSDGISLPHYAAS